MATEKFFVFNEDGALKRLKGRIVRFLDNEDPTGSDKSAIRTSLEVSPDAEGLVQADIGTAPNEIPVNGMLGDMAYQSAEGISVDKLEVTSTTGTSTTQAIVVKDSTGTKLAIQEDGSIKGDLRVIDDNGTNTLGLLYDNGTEGILDLRANNSTKIELRTAGDSYFNGGRVGVGTSSLGSYASAADDLVVATTGATGVTIHSSSADNGSIYFADGTSGDERYRGIVRYNHGADQLELWSTSAHRWSVGASGNLVPASSGLGIDFGSTNATAGVTVTGSTLDHYEEGTWTVTTSGDATGVIGASSATYTRIGNIVTIRAVFTVTTNFTSNRIGGLPYQPVGNSVSSYTGATLAMTASLSSSPVSAYVLGSNNGVHFSSGTNIGSAHAPNTTNASYRVSLSYNV